MVRVGLVFYRLMARFGYKKCVMCPRLYRVSRYDLPTCSDECYALAAEIMDEWQESNREPDPNAYFCKECGRVTDHNPITDECGECMNHEMERLRSFREINYPFDDDSFESDKEE